MFFDILKRDLKRKPLTNIIMLLFVVLSVVFISSSVNNFSSVIDSMDHYFEKAGVGDYVVAELYGGNVTVQDVVKNVEGIKQLRTEPCIVSEYQFVARNDTEEMTRYQDALISCLSNQIYRYFDSRNKEIIEVADGEVYVRQSVLDKSNMRVGDQVTLIVNDIRHTFTVKDTLKDALLGADLTNPRFLISDQDYHAFQAELEKQSAEEHLFNITYIHIIDTDDISSLETALSVCNRVYISGSRDSFRTFYVLEMSVIGVFVAVSIGLILIAIVMLRFTISNALNREFRQIGVLKAIGISNGKIRLIYLTKYLTIAIAGAIIGVILSFPFGKLILKSIESSIMIESRNSVLIALLCAVVVMLFVILFSLLCTRKVIHLTPMNALRSGTNGERYQKKGWIRLGKKNVHPALFMAINDILCKPKQSLIMMTVFFIGMVMLMIVLNASSTMLSKKMLSWEAEAEFDLQLQKKDDRNSLKYFVSDGRDRVCETIAETEAMLANEGWQADCVIETRVNAFICAANHPDKIMPVYCREGVNGSTEAYAYIEGSSAPQNKNEVAISSYTADHLGITIGDRIIVKTEAEETECYVTAIFQEIMLKEWGSIRRYPDQNYSYAGLKDVLETRVRFKDNPNAAEIEKRVEILREKHPEYKVQTVDEQLSLWFGSIPKTINQLSNLLLPIIIIIGVLIALLTELSFLAKECGEIAMLKAIGFNLRTIILWQVLRIGMVSAFATLLSIALANPIGRLTLGSVYHSIGIRQLIFVPNVWKNYVLYPAAVQLATLFSVFLIALSVRRIRTNEINSIE